MIVGFSWGSTDHAVLAGSYYDNIRFHEVKIIRSIKLDSSYNQFVPLSLSANNAKFASLHLWWQPSWFVDWPSSQSVVFHNLQPQQYPMHAPLNYSVLWSHLVKLWNIYAIPGNGLVLFLQESPPTLPYNFFLRHPNKPGNIYYEGL